MLLNLFIFFNKFQHIAFFKWDLKVCFDFKCLYLYYLALILFYLKMEIFYAYIFYSIYYNEKFFLLINFYYQNPLKVNF